MAESAGSAAAAEVALQGKEYEFVFALVAGALDEHAPECQLLLPRASAYLATCQYQLALADASLCIELDSSNARGFLYAGSAQLHMRDYAAAAALLEQGLALQPASQPLAEMCELARAAAGNRMETADDMKTMERVALDVHLEAEDWAAAIEILDEVVAIEPMRPRARCYRGRAYLAQGRLQDALQEARWAVHLDEKYGEGYELQGSAQLALGELQQAYESLQLAQEHGEGCVCSMGLDCLSCALDERVLQVAEQVSQFADQTVEQRVTALVDLAEKRHSETNHPANALPQLDMAIQISAFDAPLYCYRSSIHHQLLDEKAAIADAQKAVELAPDSCDAQVADSVADITVVCV